MRGITALAIILGLLLSTLPTFSEQVEASVYDYEITGVTRTGLNQVTVELQVRFCDACNPNYLSSPGCFAFTHGYPPPHYPYSHSCGLIDGRYVAVRLKDLDGNILGTQKLVCNPTNWPLNQLVTQNFVFSNVPLTQLSAVVAEADVYCSWCGHWYPQPKALVVGGVRVCIDAGHGGTDLGVLGWTDNTPGTATYPSEKYINLEIALNLKASLEKKGYEVVMTRTTDVNPGFQERCDIANNSGCDIFVSIHANGSSDTSVDGTETYYLPGSIDGLDLAERIESELVKKIGLDDRGVEGAEFYVLEHTNMPAALVEVGFLTNQSDYEFLTERPELPATINVLNGGEVVLMDLEEYLRGVVASEMYSNWDIEALKAQAVAARTFAATANRHPEVGAQVCTTEHCQAWTENYNDAADQAVNATFNQVIMYDRDVIGYPVYFSHCIGETRNSEDYCPASGCWYYCSYLRSVSCGGVLCNTPSEDSAHDGCRAQHDSEGYFGHGVGMCQYGAQAMAADGKTYVDILWHYYTGIYAGAFTNLEEAVKGVSDGIDKYFEERGLTITVKCPVELVVTDPDGLRICKDFTEIPGASYAEIEIEGEPGVQIRIPDRKVGEYLIEVVPKPGALPTDTFTLETSLFGESVIIARNVQISDIPAEPYVVVSTETGIIVNQPPVADAGPDQTVFAIPPATTAMVMLDGSGSHDPDGDPLTYTWTWDGNSAYGVNPAVELPLGTTTITLVVNDGKVDSEPDTVDVTVLLLATIDFDPDVLNLRSTGQYVTVYIELPAGFDVRQIDIPSIRLNGTVPALPRPTQVGDHDKDRIPDLMVKFDASAVKSLFTPGDHVEITITGEVAGILFEGTDIIRVIDPTWYSLVISSTAGGSVAVPGEGTFPYKGGTIVNLVAIPDAGYCFVGWTGDVGTIADANAASATITVNANYFVTASFEPTTRTWRVDDDLADYPDADFTGIQDAVDAASPGDTIIVYPGTYIENVDVDKDHLTVQSQSGAETTIIQGTAPGEYIIEITADYVSIDGFCVTGSGWSWRASIYIAGASYCTISNNSVHASAWHGIFLEDSGNNTIEGNSVSRHYENITLVRSSHNRITRNGFADGVYFGVVIWTSSNINTLSDNAFMNDGLWVADSYSTTVEGNTVNGKPLVYLEGQSDYVVADAGQVILVNCTNITVDGLDLSHTSVGIELWQTSDSRIANNLATDCHRYGIYLGHSNGNDICHNHFSAYTGIDLFVSDNNTLTSNNISNCYYNIGLSGCVGNAIYLNNFMAYVYGDAGDTDSANYWDSPAPIIYTYDAKTYTNHLGNYWSDYMGSDADGDGIGDIPHPIDSDADNYPLVEPFENYTVTPGPRTWYVDDDLADYPYADFIRIQGAVDAASSGDTIIVYPGTYSENVAVNKDYLTIRSENGSEKTIVQAANPDDHVFDAQAAYVRIRGFTVKGATGWERCGIYVADGADYCEICNNSVSDNCFGIKLSFSSNDLVANNEISSNWRQGIYLDFSRNSEISANTLVSNGVFIFGYHIPDFDTHIIEGNTVNGKPIYYYENESGIQVPSDAGEVILANCRHMTVKNINASFGSVGIELAYTSESEVVSNDINSNWCGILSYYSSDNRILDNNASNNVYCGMYLFSSSNNTLTNNIALNNDCGIVLWNCSTSNVIMHNSVSHNSFCGVSLEDYSNGNLVTDNIVSYNGWAIRLYNSSGNTIVSNGVSDNYCSIHLDYSDGNEICLNNFVSYTQNAYSYESTNTWNSLEEIAYTYNGNTYTDHLGNYWDDYDGSDGDGDGIGDTPYPIDSDADNYPLREPFENYMTGVNKPEASFSLSNPSDPFCPVIDQEITFNASSSKPSEGASAIVGYLWEFDDGAGPIGTTSPICMHTYSADLIPEGIGARHFTVVLTVMDDLGRTDGTSFDLTVKRPPVLLVHGFQLRPWGFDLDETWRTMTIDLTGKDVLSVEDYDWVYDEGLPFDPDFAMKRVEGNGFVVFISCYTHETSTPTMLDIRWYAQSLASEIELIKEHEHVAKVDIVGHSMGGIVSRTYVENEDVLSNPNQVQYRGDVRKLVFLGTPNQGVSLAAWLTWSSSLGIDISYYECAQQLAEGSVFMSQLNSGTTGEEKRVEYSGIAGNRFEYGPLLAEPNDTLVAVREVWLDEIPESRRFVFDLTHTQLRMYTGPVISSILKSPSFCGEPIPIPDFYLADLCSPGELRVYDSQGRITGLVNGQIREEIPNSVYDEEEQDIIVLPATDSYYCEVVGTEEGSYGLRITFLEGGQSATFTATDIPTTSGAVHQYAIDWLALSQGEEGVTVQIDSDADGIFERTITSDSDLTVDEFMVTKYLLLSDTDMVEISGSNVLLDGNIHSNKRIKISGSKVTVTGTKTTSPKVTVPNMADYVPNTADATIVLRGDQKLKGNLSYPDGSIIWVRNGKLEISGTITGKVWFLVDNEVVVKGNLLPADEDSAIQIYAKEKIVIGDSKTTVQGIFLAGKEMKLSGSNLKLTGLFWGKDLVHISGSKSDLTGAVISNKLLKVAGSNFKATYNPYVINIGP